MNPFDRLAPFIQEYIYQHRWTELRDVQVAACRVLFDTDDHLLLAAGTASGKTEAAFLPILTLLHEDPSPTVGALYIGPTKALINDQFFRLEGLLQEAAIPVWHWHGDVSASRKRKLLKYPSGVLQITPESLESLLLNRTAQLTRLIGGLRFVVIDEVHIFMGSDRGRQILCQLERLTRFMEAPPRRVGLSATLGNPNLAEKWLSAGTTRRVTTPPKVAGNNKVRLALEHFVEKKEHKQSGATKQVSLTPYHRYIFEHTHSRRKCLIFGNSRQQAETVIANLRHQAQQKGMADIYHVHHGSISAGLREAAEKAMREPHVPAITAATLTLELGIDIGALERVVQLEAPFSVSSFLQRLGRSGRRGEPREMWLVCREQVDGKENLPNQIPWSLLQCIAIIQLYVEEQWIEPIPPKRYPFSLLYHQTMSTLAAMGELSPARLAQSVLTLSQFRHISQDDFRELLNHLINIDHIQQMDGGGLIVGLTGERVVRHFHFYAVFPDNVEFKVKEKTKEIGTIMAPPPAGERIALAGRTWEVEEIQLKQKTVFVRRVGGKAKSIWNGNGGQIHTRILQRMRQVLLEEIHYPYLQPQAQARIEEARQLAKRIDLAHHSIFPLGGEKYCLFPWLGTVATRTLSRCLQTVYKNQLGLEGISGDPCYYLIVHQEGDINLLHTLLKELRNDSIPVDMLVKENEAPELEKYDEFIPMTLRHKAFIADYLDVVELQRELRL